MIQLPLGLQNVGPFTSAAADGVISDRPIDLNSRGAQMRSVVHLILLPINTPEARRQGWYKTNVVDPIANAAYEHRGAASATFGAMFGAIAYLIYRAVK
mgnify:CR=1 FL=1